MKLKEIPKSVFRSLQLRATPRSRLFQPAAAEVPVVVSFTSIPPRLPRVDLVVRSLLTQTRVPEKIVLWLPEPDLPKIPKRLQALVHDRFEIRPTPLTAPHKKLIHALEAFPGHVIVTCDDDLMYRRRWLESLYASHRQHPGCIIGHQLRRIRYDAQGNLLPYKAWTYQGPDTPAEAVMAIGAGGVLYPPGSLDERVQDRETFMELCPRADDLWFKMMGLLAGTRVVPPGEPVKEPIPIIGTQKYSLKKTNINQDQNRTQWEALTARFGCLPLPKS